MPRTKASDVMTKVVERTEARKAFWMEEAGIEEILMALFHEADEVTFRYELETQPDGTEKARYRVRAFLHAVTDGQPFDFGAISSDEQSTNPVDPFAEVLCAVLAARGPRSMWSDWWMQQQQGQRAPMEESA